MHSAAALPGFLAVRRGDGVGDASVSPAGLVTNLMCGPVELAYWGVPSLDSTVAALSLSRVTRTRHGETSTGAIVAALASNPGSLGRLLPPFAAARGDSDGVCMVADSMGFRQLYHASVDGGPAVLSTSALLAGWKCTADFDPAAVAVQSQLGWQIGQRTLLSGVEKLVPGGIARLDADGLHVATESPSVEPDIPLQAAVHEAAKVLRDSMEALLDDHPGAVLQLTGGQDSRLLLSAVPVARRRGLRAMTLGVPGAGDVTVAAHLAARYGLNHEVHGLADLDDVTPGEAWTMVRQAALRLDGMSDPIALAALGVAERNFDQGVRISGLGGEVARGFYYMGRVRDRSFTRRDAERLASWRMFVNEAVEVESLEPEFARWARESAVDSVYEALVGGGNEWFRATDELYLRHRMQRWAGVTDTAVAYDRVVINPMLDEDFLRIATRMTPRDKAASRFLGALQMELDPELGRIPLEGRPAPIAYAQPNLRSSARRTLSTAGRAASKAGQRLRRRNRAPAGGSTLTTKIVEHWRLHPELVLAAGLPAFFSPAWIEGVLDGRVEPQPSSVAFLTNLLVARRPLDT